jgi:phosphoserine aminotransferase
VGSSPLVVDASSDILSRPIDYSKFALIYAGAQKNLGPAGVTMVAISDDLVASRNDGLPSMLDYRVQAEADSRYNTPNTFGIYVLGLTLDWIGDEGGLTAIGERNRRKAEKLYAELDRTEFWNPVAETSSRSLMNVTFTLADETLEARFVEQATAAGLDGLQGHRSVGGMRASIYNAFPEAGVDALVAFMREFERRNG